jgi:aryl-alcohol dehydrogenase-like predicted oxidoreductase
MNNQINAAAGGTFQLGDLTINRMAFGAMRVTGEGIWGPPQDRTRALDVLKKVLRLGINFIDTADSYGPNVSEELIAEALYPYPEGLVIGTKGGLKRPAPYRWEVDAHPERLENCLKGSLQRLRVDQVDLYQLHRFDDKVPMEETLGKLAELRRKGLIRHLGLSEVSVEQCRKAAQQIEFVSVQNKYSVTDRKWEDVLNWCAEREIAFLPWNPVDAGELNNETLRQIAKKHDAGIYQVALAWLLRHKSNIVPIPGTSSPEHLMENTAAVGLELDEEDMNALNGIS